MKWSEILPPADLLARTEGVEQGLRQYQRLGRLGWIGGIAALAIQLMLVVTQTQLWQAIRRIDWSWPPWTSLLKLIGSLPPLSDILLLLAIGLLITALWVRLRLREARQPFRYTCSVGAFKKSEATRGEEKLAWLSEDLAKRLSERVGRLRFVDEKTALERKAGSTDPHIHIWGTYVIRQNRHGRWAIEITPRVRIGPPDSSPDTLAHPVVFNLPEQKSQIPESLRLSPTDYERILERVYFHVATELYRQIQNDVQKKIELLPTTYSRAVALFYEAEDYARSNTLDGYENAGGLYAQAAQLLDRRLGARPHSRWRRPFFRLRRGLAAIRFWVRRQLARLWPSLGRVELLCARAQIGYANMLLYRRDLAELSGQRINPVFEANPVSKEAHARLKKIPEDVPDWKEYFFDSCVTRALSLIVLGATPEAREMLSVAQQNDPNRAEQDSRYLFARSKSEPDLSSQLENLRRAVDLDPRFEEAFFELAITSEAQWRNECVDLDPTRATKALNYYEEVSRVNPSNLRAWAYHGYVNWLLHNPEISAGTDGRSVYLQIAKDDFQSGLEYKLIKRATSVSELNYGLARIAAETGDFTAAYDCYVEAIAEKLARGVSHNAPDYTNYYFMYMNDSIMNRFEQYKKSVESYRAKLKNSNNKDVRQQVADSVLAFVLNDYGEACYNYFLRAGDYEFESKARTAFEGAIQHDDHFVLPHFNLRSLRLVKSEQADVHLEKIAQLASNWPEGKFERLKQLLNASKDAKNRMSTFLTELAESRSKLEQAEAKMAEHLNSAAKGPKDRSPEVDEPSAMRAVKAGSSGDAGKSVFISRAGIASALAEIVESPRILKAEIDRLNHEISENRSNAKKWLEDAEKLVSSLLPHQWLWKQTDPGLSFDWATVQRQDLKDDRQWVREITDIHARALFEWASALPEWLTEEEQKQQSASDSDIHPRLRNLLQRRLIAWFAALRSRRLKTSEGAEEQLNRQPINAANIRKLLLHLQEHFLLHDFHLLLALRRSAKTAQEKKCYGDGLAEIVEDWLKAEPDAYWALTWVDYREPSLTQQKNDYDRYFSVEKMAELYSRAAVIARNRHVVIYAAERLEELAKSLKSEPKKARELWGNTIEAYRHAREIENILAENAARESSAISPVKAIIWYRQRIGCALWALGRYEDSLYEIDQILPEFAGSSENTIEKVIGEICENFGSPTTYDRLTPWLTEREKRLMKAGQEIAWKDTRRALFELHRARQKTGENLASVDPSIGRIAGSRPLQVEPIIIWLHPSVYEKKASSPAGHPLFLSYLPRRLQEIRRNFIFEIPDPLWGIDRVSLPEHSYIIEVNGVPLSIEGVYPDRSFCPRFRAIENLVSEEARNSIRSFNPLTGGRDGAWIESDDIPYFEQFGVELWDSFEYIARHMEMVIYRHLASFAGFQQVENSLLKYYDPDNEAALEARNKLLGATRAGHQAKASFVRTLQLLVAERAPAQDLGTMLAVFGEMWTPGCDLTPIVEAIRFKQKDALPRNRRGTQLVKLSLEFEATVSQWLHTNASDRVFEVTPQVKSRLLDEIGKQLDPAEAHRAAIVVGNFLLRPYLARLIATDYPQLTVLAERELRDDLRSDASLS